ncbi:MAG: hypothetical protein QOH72_5545 [Solirubrobacteraceae bacterium]|jgi:hypothetical protein|nr:hypothetical protein [Solirubrobacteraceae bacterium]
MSDQEKRPAPESAEPDEQDHHSDSTPETESLEERAHASTDAQWIAEGEEEGAP